MYNLASILSPENCHSGFCGDSQRKIFELLSESICKTHTNLDSDDVFQALLEREKLGSTTLGFGIAIPHCRLNNIPAATGCLITLKNRIDLQAQDNKNVDIIFGLVVPEEQHCEHLSLLAELAENFQDNDFCKGLRESKDDTQLYQTFLNCTSRKKAG